MSDTQDFWPDDLVTNPIKTPITLLKEQAALLGHKTNQVIRAEVETHPRGEELWHSFSIVAPTFNNYSYELFRVEQPITMYPLDFFWKGFYTKVNNDGELEDKIKQVLRDEQTVMIVRGLYSQARA